MDAVCRDRSWKPPIAQYSSKLSIVSWTTWRSIDPLPPLGFRQPQRLFNRISVAPCLRRAASARPLQAFTCWSRPVDLILPCGRSAEDLHRTSAVRLVEQALSTVDSRFAREQVSGSFRGPTALHEPTAPPSVIVRRGSPRRAPNIESTRVRRAHSRWAACPKNDACAEGVEGAVFKQVLANVNRHDFSQHEPCGDRRAFVIAKLDHIGELAFEIDTALATRGTATCRDGAGSARPLQTRQLRKAPLRTLHSSFRRDRVW